LKIVAKDKAKKIVFDIRKSIAENIREQLLIAAENKEGLRGKGRASNRAPNAKRHSYDRRGSLLYIMKDATGRAVAPGDTS